MTVFNSNESVYLEDTELPSAEEVTPLDLSESKIYGEVDLYEISSIGNDGFNEMVNASFMF